MHVSYTQVLHTSLGLGGQDRLLVGNLVGNAAGGRWAGGGRFGGHVRWMVGGLMP